MTEEDQQESGEAKEARQNWVKEAQEALDRTGDAVRTAWEATRDSRLSALESAKQAAKELGEVIDKGMSAAKERWSAADPTSPTSTTDTPAGEPLDERPFVAPARDVPIEDTTPPPPDDTPK